MTTEELRAKAQEIGRNSDRIQATRGVHVTVLYRRHGFRGSYVRHGCEGSMHWEGALRDGNKKVVASCGHRHVNRDIGSKWAGGSASACADLLMRAYAELVAAV